jgi:hypothetical protein
MRIRIVALVVALAGAAVVVACTAFTANEGTTSPADGGVSTEAGSDAASDGSVVTPGGGPAPLLWLSADMLQVADGEGVDEWRDPSGKIARAPSIDKRPVLKSNVVAGKPAVLFDADDVLVVGSPEAFKFPPSKGFSAWVVLSTPGGAYYHQFLGNESNQNRTGFSFVMEGDSGLPSFSSRNTCCPAATATKRIDDTKWHDLLGVRTGSALALYVDGQLDGQVASGAAVSFNDASELYIGKDPDGAFPFVGEIAEIIVYDASLGDAERGTVRAYLRTKYGLP